MARTPDPHSAAAQVFTNLADNLALNYGSSTVEGYGYGVFAPVVGGMEIADRMAAQSRGLVGPYEDVPVMPVQIRCGAATVSGEARAGRLSFAARVWKNARR
ncbi:MAG: hypothetical protein N2652_03100 [Kiritimatiellae bacterium]|nr:hypothetical protein [Kiritimatiellia bacterium]